MNKEEIKKIFKSKSNRLPLGYLFLKSPAVHCIKSKIVVSTFHNAHQRYIGEFYKPISLINIEK